jgi:hypothetical protein
MGPRASKGVPMVKRRLASKTTKTLVGRLAKEAIELKEAAEKQPLGSMAREQLLRRARQAETGSHVEEWLGSPGLRSPQ